MRRRSTPQSWALRCRIILACASGMADKAVAAQLGSTQHALGRRRARFIGHRIAWPGDLPRPGGPRTVTDEQVTALITTALERVVGRLRGGCAGRRGQQAVSAAGSAPVVR
ncbi:hypothetical protein Ppa06_55270 [Planomonospora parontospora subsp. parontospora]|uniref:Transposase n=2 Tax=Planomonospora parontospora TaxID=58119 RepID=A0AA37BLN8_9ACTN|nr:hypothetical protein [Planomonospora parontospora]GGK89722.1 hypothetical protein GCM10010126_56490 [Planomonospora parontospora]GII11729.1 hypothetical protein Ppa06_55270 [Planomonospora parontospora subsp. parontospora]